VELLKQLMDTDRKSNWCIYVNERGLYFINIMTGDIQREPPVTSNTEINRKLYINREKLPSFQGGERDEWGASDEWENVLDDYTRMGDGEAHLDALESAPAEELQPETIRGGEIGWFVPFSNEEKAIHHLRDANQPGWLIIALDASSPYIDTDDRVREERKKAKERRQGFFIGNSWTPDPQVIQDITQKWMRKTLWELLPRESKKFVEEQERHFSPRTWAASLPGRLHHVQKKLALAKGLHEYRDTIPQEIADKIGEYI